MCNANSILPTVHELFQGPVGLDGPKGEAGIAGYKGQKGDPGAGSGYEFMTR